MTNSVINFTQSAIESIPSPVKGMITFKDTRQPGLSIYITSGGVKTFFVRKRIKGRDERVIIGKYPDVKIEQARKKAAIICGIIADKKDPKEAERDQEWASMTFENHFKNYMNRYSKPHKKTWVQDEREINLYCKHWFKWKLNDMGKSDMERMHETIGKVNGKSQANKVINRLRSIFNKAIEWGWQGTNPAKGIKKFREKSRDRFILPNEMPFILKALQEEPNPSFRDYFTLLFYTGVRKSNALNMEWDQIVWEHKEWHIPVTKNGNPVIVPLLEPLYLLLQQRKNQIESSFVFASKKDPKKPMLTPKRAWKNILAKATLDAWQQDEATAQWMKQALKRWAINQSPYVRVFHLQELAREQDRTLPKSMTDICIHDIRRTFGSYQALTGASISVIGKSLGHSSLQATQIYARLNLDPVRASIEKATNVMFGVN